MKLTVVAAAVSGLLLAGCASQPGESNRTGAGAVIGAVAGAVIGHQIDHKSGAAVGAIVGGMTGGAIGHHMDQQEKAFNEALASEEEANQVEVERVREDLLKVTLNNEVSFDFNKATIRTSFRPTLDKLASLLRRYEGSIVTIVGHTDSVGSDSYNQQLSEERAAAVADYLISRGVEPRRLRTEGRGENEPRASNASEAGRQLNRRVEIYVQPGEGARSDRRYEDRRYEDRRYDDRRYEDRRYEDDRYYERRGDRYEDPYYRR